MHSPEQNENDKISILIVDDDPFLRDLLVRYFTQQGYNVRAVESGIEAKQEMEKSSFQIVVIDILLSEMTGIELVDDLKVMDPEIITILMTGHPSLETALAALKKGVQDYLVKPFRLEQLHEVLKRCLENKQILCENKKLKEELGDARRQLDKYQSLIRQSHLVTTLESGDQQSGHSWGNAAYRFQSLHNKETTLEDRVHKLALLKEEGLITEDEFEAKRKQLMSMGGKVPHDDASP
jgi:DNA-binding NtrC family response regulator